MSVIVVICALTVQILLFGFYFKQRERWSDQDFQDRHGTLFDGLRTKSKLVSKAMILVYIAAYFIRRVIFIISILFLQRYIFAQLLL